MNLLAIKNIFNWCGIIQANSSSIHVALVVASSSMRSFARRYFGLSDYVWEQAARWYLIRYYFQRGVLTHGHFPLRDHNFSNCSFLRNSPLWRVARDTIYKQRARLMYRLWLIAHEKATSRVELFCMIIKPSRRRNASFRVVPYGIWWWFSDARLFLN